MTRNKWPSNCGRDIMTENDFKGSRHMESESGLENMELTTTYKIKMVNFCFFINKIVGKFNFVSEFI